MAQWIRHRPTEPGIAGSSPAEVIVALVLVFVKIYLVARPAVLFLAGGYPLHSLSAYSGVLRDNLVGCGRALGCGRPRASPLPVRGRSRARSSPPTSTPHRGAMPPKPLARPCRRNISWPYRGPVWPFSFSLVNFFFGFSLVHFFFGFSLLDVFAFFARQELLFDARRANPKCKKLHQN